MEYRTPGRPINTPTHLKINSRADPPPTHDHFWPTERRRLESCRQATVNRECHTGDIGVRPAAQPYDCFGDLVWLGGAP